MSEDTEIAIGEDSFSLADLAGVNMDDVQEVRGFTFPKISGLWESTEAKLAVVGSGNNRKATVQLKSKLLESYGAPDDVDESKYIGKEYTEMFFFGNEEPVDTLGRIKAFMADAGFKGSGQLQELLDGFVGTKFKAKINHKPNPNDEDNPYTKMIKVAPYVEEETEAA